MSLENSIDNLAQAIQALASALNPNIIKAPIVSATPTIVGPPFTSTEVEAPKRTRRTKEQIAADEATKQSLAQDPLATRQPAPTIEEDFLPEEAPAPTVTFTEGDVRTALMALRDKDGSKDRAVAILRKHTGQEVLPGAPPSSYGGIIGDCTKAMGL